MVTRASCAWAPRKGDNAELAILELVDNTVRPKHSDSKKRTRARRILKAEEKAEAAAALAETAEATEAVEEEVTEEVVEESTDAPEAATDEAEDEEKKED